jgi:DNA polymerase-3 subunit gamma/tau
MAQLPTTMKEVVALIDRQKPALANHLNDCAALIALDAPDIAIRLTHVWAQGDIKRDLTQALNDATPGTKWTVRLEDSGGEATLQQQENAVKAAARAEILETPVVKAAMAAFPDAELDDKLEQWSA